MYRLSTDLVSTDNEANVRYFVSESLADWMECVLGTVNDNGFFFDQDRAVKFLNKVGFFEFTKLKLTKGKGLLCEEVDILDLIMKRYSDIYAKVKDPFHEYTFNEFGELLISKLIELNKSCAYSYLSFYENNTDRFNNCIEYFGDNECSVDELTLELVYNDEDWYIKFVPFSERCDSVLWGKIDRALCAYGETIWEDLVTQNDDLYDDKTGLVKPNAPSVKDFASAYTQMWREILSNISLYGLDGYPEELINYDTSNNARDEVIADMLSTCNESILFWDNDYEMFEHLLQDPEALDSYLKEMQPALGYVCTSLRDIFNDKDIEKKIG